MAVGLFGSLCSLRVDAAHAQPEAQAFVCPMHAEVRRSAEGKCPRCGMQLVATLIDDFRPYSLTVQSRPSPARAGNPVELVFTVRDPRDMPVHDFVAVHERPFHLFIVSEDLSSFQHVHPVVTNDGTLTVSTVLPSPGRYQLIADFFPQGGIPQQLERAIVTAGYTAPLGRSHLVPDAVLRQRAGDLMISLVPLTTTEGATPTAGVLALFDIRVTDAQGRPVALEPYLGAWAHVLMVNESLSEAIHAHADRVTGVSGALRLELLPPTAGVYRMWIQVQHGGEVLTAPFTFAVAAKSAAYLP
jgi:hypothetical protein